MSTGALLVRRARLYVECVSTGVLYLFEKWDHKKSFGFTVRNIKTQFLMFRSDGAATHDGSRSRATPGITRLLER